MPKEKTDWKQALRKLADAVEEFTDSDADDPTDFCNGYCPAAEHCKVDTCWERGNCRRMMTKWAKATYKRPL